MARTSRSRTSRRTPPCSICSARAASPAPRRAAPRATAARAPSRSSTPTRTAKNDLPRDQQLHHARSRWSRAARSSPSRASASRERRSTRCSRRWSSSYGSQCGYCTPGLRRLDVRGLTTATGSASAVASRSPISSTATSAAAPATGRSATRCSTRSPKRRDEPRRSLPARALEESDRRRSRALAYEATRTQRFLRPTTLDELLALQGAAPRARELVAGATEIGVYINKQHRRYPLLVSTEGVRELAHDRRRRRTRSAIGGAATLTALEEALARRATRCSTRCSGSSPRGRSATARRSPATSSPPRRSATCRRCCSRSTPSVVLARRTAAHAHACRSPSSSSPTARRRSRPTRSCEAIVRPAHARRAGARASHGLVQGLEAPRARHQHRRPAAFVRRDSTRADVVRARAPRLRRRRGDARARDEDRGVARRQAVDASRRCARAQDVLAAEFTPIDDVRAGAAYRRGLVTSLLEKFFRGETSAAQDRAARRSTRAARPRSRRRRASRALAHESAIGHVTGARALRRRRRAAPRPMLELWPVIAPARARAHHVRRDTTEARARCPASRACSPPRTCPAMNDVGAIRHDEPLLRRRRGARSTARSSRSSSATSYEPCRARGREGEGRVRAAAGDPRRRARRSRRRASTPSRTSSGAATSDAALATAPASPRRRASTSAARSTSTSRRTRPGPRAARTARCSSSSSTQHPSEVQAVVSHVLAPAAQQGRRCSRRAWAAASAARRRRATRWAALAALAAMTTGASGARAARSRPRHAAHRQAASVLRARSRSASTPTAGCSPRSIELVSRRRLGARSLRVDLRPRAVPPRQRLLHARRRTFRGRVAKTNVVSHTAFRGFGGPQGMLVIEEILDRIARRARPAARGGARAEPLPRQRRDEHDALRPGARRRAASRRSGPTLKRSRRARAAPRGDRARSTRRAPARQARPRDHAGEVRHLVHRHVPEPGRRARARLPGRHRAGEPRRHRDGPGALHEDAGRRDARARRPRRARSA